METEIIKLDAANPQMAKIKHAAEVIDACGLVAFPTETVYGIACRVEIDSLARLDKLKSRNLEKYYTLHIGQKDDVNKFVPRLGLRIQKLINNTWPGPLTIVFQLTAEDLARQQDCLEKDVFENLYRDNSIGIRCPDNLIAAKLLQSIRNPVVAPSANISGCPPPVNADQVAAGLSGQIDLILDGGTCKYQKSSTIVKTNNEKIQILRPGFYTKNELEKLSQVNFLFVCTGNTCRSPMAKAIFAKYLAEKLQCNVDQLEKKGYKTASAGTMGIEGVPVSSEAVVACAAKGINIENHLSSQDDSRTLSAGC